MKNPWLEIPWDDYENHMSDAQVGQLQILNSMTRDLLLKFQPAKLAILGISTGNGLDHVDTEVTREVYGVDINPRYLDVVRQRFGTKMPGLKLLALDLNHENIPFSGCDLVIAALVLEYLNIEVVLPKLREMMADQGYLAIIFQSSGNATFVSKSKYDTLEKLDNFHHEIKESDLCKRLSKLGLDLQYRQDFRLKSGKSLIQLLLRLDRSKI